VCQSAHEVSNFADFKDGCGKIILEMGHVTLTTSTRGSLSSQG